MKLIAPISKIYEVEDIIKAGADELYCGVYTEEWRKTYTDIAAPNRHPGRSSNLCDFKELQSVVKLAHTYNTPVLFTINEFYAEGQYDLVINNIEAAIHTGVDALIIADINLLLLVKNRGCNIKIHIGTGATTFNSQTVAFYKNLGASRVILDRQLSIEEIGLIVSLAPDIELEVFALNQRCHNIDGFCTFQHGITATKFPFFSKVWNMKLVKKIINLYHGDTSKIEEIIFRNELGCCLGYEITNCGIELEPKNRTRLLDYFNARIFLNRCGACALYDLNKFKIGFIKIVGREDFTVKKVRDIRFIRSSLELLKNNIEKQAFLKEVKSLYKNTYSFDCADRFCYYPS